jgi:DNA-binding NtrC family response regulator
MPDRILVVEDDDATRCTFQKLIEAAGYRVGAFRDYFEAAEAIDAGWGALLVVSIKLRPGSPHGIAVANMARTHRPRMPVVFATGFEDLAAEASEIGPVLMKPVAPDVLLTTIRRQLDESMAASGQRRVGGLF